MFVTCTIREGGGLCKIQQQGRGVIDMEGRGARATSSFVTLYGICQRSECLARAVTDVLYAIDVSL